MSMFIMTWGGRYLTKKMATRIYDQLVEIIKQSGVASVADLNSITSTESTQDDYDVGWRSWSDMVVIPLPTHLDKPNKYGVSLPDPVEAWSVTQQRGAAIYKPYYNRPMRSTRYKEGDTQIKMSKFVFKTRISVDRTGGRDAVNMLGQEVENYARLGKASVAEIKRLLGIERISVSDEYIGWAKEVAIHVGEASDETLIVGSPMVYTLELPTIPTRIDIKTKGLTPGSAIIDEFIAPDDPDYTMCNHPNHYQSSSGLEVLEVIEAFTEDLKGIEATDTGNILKYACRWSKKNGIQDLKKILVYTNHLIKHLEKKENSK